MVANSTHGLKRPTLRPRYTIYVLCIAKTQLRPKHPCILLIIPNAIIIEIHQNHNIRKPAHKPPRPRHSRYTPTLYIYISSSYKRAPIQLSTDPRACSSGRLSSSLSACYTTRTHTTRRKREPKEPTWPRAREIILSFKRYCFN